MIYSKISGTGSYLPKRVMLNKELEQMVDTSDEWIVERTGIKQRYIAEAGETTSYMASQAALTAIARAHLKPDDIGLIIVATCTPDQIFPSTACLLQEKLQINQAIPAFDITAACAGFVYALTMADQFIKSGKVKHALVVGSEVMSKVVNWHDRTTCVLFGDGAGAVVLSASKQPGILVANLYAQGKYKDILYLTNPYTHTASTNYLSMEGAEVFKFAVKSLEHSIPHTLSEASMTLSDLDWLIPHQANMRILQLVSKKLNIPMEKMIITMDQQGNTSAASIPLALDGAVMSGKVKAGHSLLLEGFGGGMTWGSLLVKL